MLQFASKLPPKQAQSAADAGARTLAGVREEGVEAARRREEEVGEHASSLAEAQR